MFLWTFTLFFYEAKKIKYNLMEFWVFRWWRDAAGIARDGVGERALLFAIPAVPRRRPRLRGDPAQPDGVLGDRGAAGRRPNRQSAAQRVLPAGRGGARAAARRRLLPPAQRRGQGRLRSRQSHKRRSRWKRGFFKSHSLKKINKDLEGGDEISTLAKWLNIFRYPHL